MTRTKVELRLGSPTDAEACGAICYESYARIAAKHGFPPEFPSLEIAISLTTMLLSHPRFHSIVAEQGGRVVGSMFVDERCAVAGIGPGSVDSSLIESGTGRLLMQ